MPEYQRRINKRYQKFTSEIEDGLSTYDLQLLSLENNRQKSNKCNASNHEETLVA